MYSDVSAYNFLGLNCVFSFLISPNSQAIGLLHLAPVEASGSSTKGGVAKVLCND